MVYIIKGSVKHRAGWNGVWVSGPRRVPSVPVELFFSCIVFTEALSINHWAPPNQEKKTTEYDLRIHKT